MQKVLFLVPHEDDELFIGGPLLINLSRDKNYDVYVFIATNGDYYSYEHCHRIMESIDVLATIGLKKTRIIFGGYGDCWRGPHIYNAKNDEIKISHSGFSSTYLDGPFSEWHFEYYNKHQLYTRGGYLNDIKIIIEEISPEIIISVDLDSHMDHRCLSLLTEEALSELFKSNLYNDYRPLLLKKFAYKNVLFGKEDFFEYPHKRTVDYYGAMDNPFFSWNDRISYNVPHDCSTFFLHSNFLYKLARKYKSQNMWTFAPSFINEDIVYWQRYTNNEVLRANITVSSGNKKYLNDFKLVDSDNIKDDVLNLQNLCWRPSATDKLKQICIKFKNAKKIKYINIYFNCPKGLNGRYKIVCNISDSKLKTFVRTINCKSDYFIDKLELTDINMTSFIVDLKELKGNIGLGEIEAMPDMQSIPFKEYLFKKIVKKSENCTSILNVALLIEKIIFKFQKIFYYRTDRWVKMKAEFDRRIVNGRK